MIRPCSEVLQLKVEDEELEEHEDERFYDTREEISPIVSNSRQNSFPLDCQQFTLWNELPSSVQERRNRFKRCMGLSFSSNSSPRLDSINHETGMENEGESVGNINRQGRSNSGPQLLGSSNSEIGHSTTTSFSSEHSDSEDGGASSRNHFYSFKNLDDGSVFIADDELQEDGSVGKVYEVARNHTITIDEFQRNVTPSPFVPRFMRREDNSSLSSTSSEETLTKMRRKTMSGPSWLKRFGAVACLAADTQEDANVLSLYTDFCHGDCKFRMKVQSYKKPYKEFSAVYTNQEIQAHNGNILTMKFSHDGRYLATGGEDGIIRVWQITERDRIDDEDLPQMDLSCIFFNADDSFELTPICMNKSSSMRITSDSACVVIPPKLFGISEKPLYEFHGHTGEILDLAWSKNKSILSSSADDTVRLWEFGSQTWKQIYPHNNVVTCLQFNPVEEDSFITGCIDGKVRIWHTSDAHVIDWLDVKDIVTAVCYGPDGKEVVVGSITGICRFYTMTDNHLELSHQLRIHRKKKSSGKMITGFQFSPNTSERLLVTCADSRVRILDKLNVICKYKGLQNSSSRISASFTKDGKHIISASENSNVYIWNNKQDVPTTNNVKRNSSCERFYSTNASVAIPWHGFSNIDKLSPSPSNSTTLNQDLLAQVPLRSTATWPEEKLQSSAVLGASFASKAEKRLFKTSYDAKFSSSHAWGQVIVTGSLDGRIRSFQNYGLPSLF